MFLWFAGVGVVLVYHVFRSPGLDYRWIMLGTVTPVGEVVLGGPRVLHALVGSVAALVVVMVATRRHRLTRRRLLGWPIGLFVHLVLDGSWMRSRVFWWPFLGSSFAPGRVPELAHGWFAVVLELVGAGALAWSWRAFGLADPARRRAFVHSGQLVALEPPAR